MNDNKNVLIGILAIILGLIIIMFPLISVFTINQIAGIGIIFLGIWALLQSFKTGSFAAGTAGIIIALFAFALGVVFIANIKALEFFTFISLYLVGFFIILAGFAGLISGKGLKEKLIGVIGLIIGVLFLAVGAYAANPFVLAAIIGAFLIIAGLMEVFNLFGEKEIKNETK
jgi:membrane protein HdeD